MGVDVWGESLSWRMGSLNNQGRGKSQTRLGEWVGGAGRQQPRGALGFLVVGHKMLCAGLGEFRAPRCIPWYSKCSVEWKREPGTCRALSCCLVTQSCLTLWDPMDYSTRVSSLLHHLLGLAQTHVHWVSVDEMLSNHLILCLLLLLPSVLPSIRVFLGNESALRVRWPKCWSFSCDISPSSEYAGLGLTGLIWPPAAVFLPGEPHGQCEKAGL